MKHQTNPYLDRMVALETYADILRTLRPCHISLIALLLEGLNEADAGTLLGISRQAANNRLYKARKLILSEMPHLQRWARGRNKNLGTPRPRRSRPEETP
jgi:DNA-directed RNA polymerase specialized sigma24 family protein